MLNKENRKILKTLSGEYHAFALKLKQEVFSRCSDWKAINENLYDMLEMLRSAQEEKRTFSEVIPDPDQTIKETVLCFPAKRYHKILAIGFGAAACIVVASALLVYNAAFAPVQLNSVGTLFYDSAQGILNWTPVKNAAAYEIYANGEKVSKTYNCNWSAAAYGKENYELYVVAIGEGRYRSSEKSELIRLTDVYPIEEATIGNALHNITYSAGNFLKMKVVFKPEYNAFAKINTNDHATVEQLTADGKTYISTTPQWYYEGETYTFMLTKAHYTADFLFNVTLAELEDVANGSVDIGELPIGQTIFSRVGRDVCKAYRSEKQGIYFTETDEKYNMLGPIQNSFTTRLSVCETAEKDTGKLIVTNDTGKPAPLRLTESVVPFSENMIFEKGYTLIDPADLPQDGDPYDDGLAFFSRNDLTVYRIAYHNTLVEKFFLFGSETHNGIVSVPYLEEWRFLVYCAEKTIVQTQLWHSDTSSGLYLQDTVTLQPGLNQIQISNYDCHKLSADKYFYAYDPYNGEYVSDLITGVNTANGTSLYYCYVHLFDFPGVCYWLFNPYDEPLEITVIKYTEKP